MCRGLLVVAGKGNLRYVRNCKQQHTGATYMLYTVAHILALVGYWQIDACGRTAPNCKCNASHPHTRNCLYKVTQSHSWHSEWLPLQKLSLCSMPSMPCSSSPCRSCPSLPVQVCMMIPIPSNFCARFQSCIQSRGGDAHKGERSPHRSPVPYAYTALKRGKQNHSRN